MRSSLRLFIWLFILFKSFDVTAQKEHSVWHFGANAGIRFYDDTVLSINGGAINSREGCASVSGRKSGSLLFYTDGTKIWNRNHSVMPNGNNLFGNYSSAQSALIVPFPADTNKYYVFTTHTGAGMYYSVVDMTLNSGLGDVVSGSKNINLLSTSNSSEKLTATKHCNDTDYWVITHLVNGRDFYVYKVSSTGLSSPSVYTVGTNFTVGGWMEAAQLKVSINGKKIANAIGPQIAGGASSVQLFDFNNSTGQISSPTSTLTGFAFAYGVEFSPNGRFLYVTELAAGRINQYDLQATNIPASKVLLESSSSLLYGGLQLGPDGKIYVTAENGYNVPYRYLSVIRKPDLPGTTCNFVKDHVDLGSNGTLIGLPTLFSSNDLIRQRILGPVTVCASSTDILYTVENYISGTNVTWQMKSAASLLTSSSDSTAKVNFRPTAGWDTLVISYPVNCGGTITEILPIRVIFNTVSIGNDTMICFNNPHILNAGLPGSKYSWNGSVSDTLQTKTINNPGLYWVKVTDVCRDIYDSILITTPNPIPPVFLGNDTLYCGNFTRTLDAGTTQFRYLWSTGSTDTLPTMNVSSPGLYSLRVSNGCMTIYDSIVLSQKTIVKPFLGNDTTLCSPISLMLNSASPGNKHQWSTSVNDTLPQVTINSGGTFYLQVSNECGSLSDTIVITEAQSIQQFDLLDSLLCDNDSLIYNAAVSPGLKYQWSASPGDTLPYLNIKDTGVFWLLISGPCNQRADTFSVRDGSLSHYSGFPDSTICGDVDFQINIPTIYKVSWENGDSSNNRNLVQKGTYAVTISNMCGSLSDTITIDYSASGSTVLIPNAFTPGADQINPLFPFNDSAIASNLEKYHLAIYNRWGEKVFETRKSSENWDGNYSGKEAPEGVYFYQMSFKDCSKHGQIINGIVHLIR